MRDEILIIVVLAVAFLCSLAMCVNLVKELWDKQDSIDKLWLERNFYKAEYKALQETKTRQDLSQKLPNISDKN